RSSELKLQAASPIRLPLFLLIAGKKKKDRKQPPIKAWIVVAYSAPVAATTAVFLIYPIGRGSFSDGMPIGISSTFNFMIVFQQVS
ncbi:photosystem ii protein d1, partial [Phtheirospermum japonicum]